MLAFWQSRLKDAVATGRRLLECASVHRGCLEVQLEYVQSGAPGAGRSVDQIAGLVTRFDRQPSARRTERPAPTTTALG